MLRRLWQPCIAWVDVVAGAGSRWSQRESAGDAGADVPRAGETSDLPFHARRAVARGHVRLQTRSDPRHGKAVAVREATDSIRQNVEPAQITLGIQTIRRIGHDGERSVPTGGRVRG